MNAGLIIYNDRGGVVLDSTNHQYRFVTKVNMAMFSPAPSTPYWKSYRADITEDFKDTCIIVVEYPEGKTGSYKVTTSGGRYYVTSMFGSSDITLQVFPTPPVCYIFSDAPPPSKASNFGMEITDEFGEAILNTDYPLLKVNDFREITTLASAMRYPVWTYVGPSADQLLAVETKAGQTAEGYTSDGFYVEGWSIETKNEGGSFFIRTAEYTQGMGEAEVDRTISMRVRIILIQKPIGI